MADRIGAGVDGEHARVRVVGAAEAVSGVNEDATCGWSGIGPPRPGDRQPQKPDVQVAMPRVSGPLGRRAPTRVTRAASPRLGGLIISSIKVASARSTGRFCSPTSRGSVAATVGLTELDGELARREESASSVRGLTELGRSPLRGDRDVESPAVEGTLPCVLEFQGDVFVHPAH